MSKTRARNVLAAYYCFPIGSPETLKQQAFSSLGPCSPLVSSFAFLSGVFVVRSSLPPITRVCVSSVHSPGNGEAGVIQTEDR